MCSGQLSFLEPLPSLPEGLEYRAELASPDEEAELLKEFRELDFREYEFHGYFGKRRVVSFGLRYDPNESTVRNTGDIPGFLLTLRQKAADFARLAPSELQQALVTEYTPGAAIGWHRDRPAYRDVIGVSFSSSCRFRLRPQAGQQLGTRFADLGAAFGVPAARPGSDGMAAQHPARRALAVFRHIQKHAGRRISEFLRGSWSICQPLNSAAIGSDAGRRR